MSGETVCPFCCRDPFDYVHNGLGLEPVAVTCCDLGDSYFRGAREDPKEVTLSYDEFKEIGYRLFDAMSRQPVEDRLDDIDAKLEVLMSKLEGGEHG